MRSNLKEGRKSFRAPLIKSPSNRVKVETPPSQVKALDKGKGIASEPPKRFEGKKYFKCHGFGHFQADCPNRKALTIKEVEEIRAIEEESSKEDDENDGVFQIPSGRQARTAVLTLVFMSVRA